MTASRRDYELAFQDGARCRRRGGKLQERPDYGSGADARTLQERWEDGYESENKGEGRTKR